jgi:hypothetical protein
VGRGALSKEVQRLALLFLKREIDLKELRLYPYIDYVSKNFSRVDLNRLDPDEDGILFTLCVEGHLSIEDKGAECGEVYISITKDFYIYLQRVLWVSYVEKKLEKQEAKNGKDNS